MKTLLFSISIFSIFSVVAQPSGGNATEVLKAVSSKLNALNSVSYTYIREMKYVADNYENTDTASVYMEFSAALPMGVRLQAGRTGSLYVYDGQMTLNVQDGDMTIDSATAITRRMESNSYLYNSFLTLRNVLPLVIANDSFAKKVSDTSIAGKKYMAIRMEAPFTALGVVKGYDRFKDPAFRRPYVLIIDKATLLPFQFVSQLINGDDDRDYVRVTYSSVNPRPAAKNNASWTYAAYSKKYKPYVEPLTIPLVQAGATLPAFRLPLYKETGTDSVSSESLKGKLVLIEFWFKSCGPCIAALPKYNAFQEKFRDKGFELVTVNIEDPVKDIEFFYQKYPPNYNMLYSGRRLFEQLGFEGCPSSVLVDRDGKVVKTFSSFNEQEIEQQIQALP